MKKLLVLLLCCLMLPAHAQEIAGYEVTRSREKKITEGVHILQYSLRKLQEGKDPLRQRLVVVSIDPSKNNRLFVTNALPKQQVHTLQKTSLTAKQEKGGRVLAAFNGDFFDIAAGGPLGFNMTEGRWLTSGEFPDAIALGFDAAGRAVLSNPGLSLQLHAQRQGAPVLQDVPIHALNSLRSDVPLGFSLPQNAFHARQDNHLVLYTSDFGPATYASDGGYEVVVKTQDLVVSGGDLQGIVTAIHGTSTITTDGALPARGTRLTQGTCVLSAAGPSIPLLQQLKAGDHITISCRVDAAWQQVVAATGGGRPDGGPLLIQHGTYTEDATWADDYVSFYRRHARTAFGLRADGSYFFVFAPQGEDAKSDGILVSDLRNIMRFLGAQDALNLDGGPSATLALPRGKQFAPTLDYRGTVRQRETRVGNSLLLVERKK